MVSKQPQKPFVERAYELIHPLYQNQKNYGIKEEWLIGLISQECSRLDAKAFREEPHVIEDVFRVKTGQTPKGFPGFNSGAIKSFIVQTHDKASLRSLGTSYGLGQIMGYHYVAKWGLTPEVYKNLTLSQSIDYTMRMMATTLAFAAKAGKPGEENDFKEMMRIWNTGSISGRTHNADYCQNAYKMMLAYRKLLESKKNASS
jgi:hypothetical protein